jgi:SNF2 family DNA or RNA helicase
LNDVKHSPGYALLMEMGCGKTITSVAITGRAYLNGLINRVLIIAPKSIVAVWHEEFHKFADFPYQLTLLSGSSVKKKQLLRKISNEGLQIAVVNYDSVALIEDEIHKWHPEFIVADESTRIKNPQAKCSKAIHRIAKNCKYRMILTGSPITKNPLDLFSQYKMLDESLFGSSYYAFKNHFAVLGDFRQPIGYRNMPELIKKAHSIAYRVTKADALDLPDTIDEIHPIHLEEKAQRMYKQFVRDSYMELSKGEVTATNILTRLLRLQQITGGFIKPDEEVERYQQVSTAKLEALSDIVDSVIESGEKLVIMVRFIPEIKEITKLLDKKKLKYALIHGGIKDRAEEIRRFQEDEDCKVFVGQIQTTSMGITLTAASTCVFYSLSYNYADYIQAKARIHRIGQTKKCVYIHLVAKGTIDETVMQALEKKEDIAHTIVDNWRSIIK